jgi:hypothetical protein
MYPESKPMNEQHHEMVLEKTHPSGADEWYCPMCGRRFLMQSPPAYKKIVLEPGDEQATHSGSKGGLRIGSIKVTQGKEDQLSEESLRLWQKALEEIDIHELGDEKAA